MLNGQTAAPAHEEARNRTRAQTADEPRIGRMGISFPPWAPAPSQPLQCPLAHRAGLGPGWKLQSGEGLTVPCPLRSEYPLRDKTLIPPFRRAAFGSHGEV